VFADLAAAVADGADCIDGVDQLCGDREHVFGAAASTTTMWRLVDQRIDAAHLPRVRAARAAARAAAWTAGAAPAAGDWLHIDIDATLVIDHSDNKDNAAPTWKKTFGHHPLLAFLDRPQIAGGEPLAGLLRAGNAGSNTAADHITVLEQALSSLPVAWRPDPVDSDDPDAARVLVRCDSAGATHGFADACRGAGVGFSFGHPVDARVRDAVDTLNRGHGWYPAIDTDGGIRDGAWVAEATTLVDLSAWPAGTRLILRKERPHPGAQLRFTDADGMRVTAFITDTPPGVVAGQLAGLELRHRQHARVEDRIRELKAAGLTNLPCQSFDANAAWLEIVLVQPIWWPGPSSSDSSTIPSWPAARSPPSATGSCMWQPGLPAAPANCGCAWMPPGGGHLGSRPPGKTSAPPSVDRSTTRPTDHERPTGTGKARPTRRHGTTQHAIPRKFGHTHDSDLHRRPALTPMQN
jgi:hypothetical protein